MIEKEQIIKIPSIKGKISSPSILATEEGYLLATIVEKKERYRTKTWKSKERPSKYSLSLTKLDDNLHPVGSCELLEPKLRSGVPLFHLTHVHLVSYNKGIWAFYTNQPAPGKTHLYAAPLIEEKGNFTLGRVQLISLPSNHWSPLVLDDQLYLFSDTSPLSCMQLDLASGTSNKLAEIAMESLWPFGKIEMHCPMIKTELGIVSFFHSMHKEKGRPVYVIGAWSPHLTESGCTLYSMLEHPIGSSKTYSLLTNRKKRIAVGGVTEKEGSLIISTLLGSGKVGVMQIKTKELFYHLQPVANRYEA